VGLDVLLAKIAHHLRNHGLVFGGHGSFHENKMGGGREREYEPAGPEMQKYDFEAVKSGKRFEV